VNTSASTPVLNPETPLKNKEKGKKEETAEEEDYPIRSCLDVNDFADNETYISSLEDGKHLFHRTEGKGQGQGGEPLFLSGLYSEALVPMSGVKIGTVQCADSCMLGACDLLQSYSSSLEAAAVFYSILLYSSLSCSLQSCSFLSYHILSYAILSFSILLHPVLTIALYPFL
jgi:hypothetical protein